ncbi:hypothetical protein [Actinoplanes sp. NPDC026670]|uniref:hypothetical protein n=1 Tax=Actinoplanes sp. NPDC026670 TaxID=3154700 RepID=UPI0033D0EF2A
MAEEPTERQKELVADCTRLWEAGEMKLKPLAAHYRSVITRIAAAETRVDVLWRDQLLGGPFGEAKSAWQYLADTTVDLLRESAESLEATGDVLIMAALEYQEAERINTEAIAEQKRNIVRAEGRDGTTFGETSDGTP